ncbi:hypothetical protein FOL47_010765 [Perkinsus chesapeaki]|uniref:Thymus-specific serine protease n=1 Tax=Perkinsus chesapeaki TaxID=330153 RepID=A0A7J6L0J8_PERCH|nr:hypothetical protein FOL47_010765 [Perkinsus chesapeaki]
MNTYRTMYFPPNSTFLSRSRGVVLAAAQEFPRWYSTKSLTTFVAQACIWTSSLPPLGTFKQRYLYSDKFVNGSKPELVIVDIKAYKMDDFYAFYVSQVASRTQSIVVALEHRFYGKSFPNSSPTTADLRKLLQTNQAIADLVTFREFIIKKYGLSGVKFVLMGCSFAGSLAAWARVKHPDLFLGAVASCPVINLKYDFPEFLNTYGDLFSNKRIGGSPECLAFIRRVSGIIKGKIATSAGRRQIESVFGLRAMYLEDQKTRLLW